MPAYIVEFHHLSERREPAVVHVWEAIFHVAQAWNLKQTAVVGITRHRLTAVAYIVGAVQTVVGELQQSKGPIW